MAPCWRGMRRRMRSAADASAVCAHRDLFYVFQDSPGAPLKAIYFDAEGHVIQYDVEIRHEDGAYGRRDYAIFPVGASVRWGRGSG